MARLTEEQGNIVKAVAVGNPRVKAVAGAGTGKTHSLRATAYYLSQRQNKRVLYNAFNKALQLEAAEKFKGLATAKTPHSMAFGAMQVYRWGGDKLNKRLFPNDVARRFGLKGMLGIGDGVAQAMLIQKTVDAFCQSADHEITTDHALRAGCVNETIAPEIVNRAQDLWAAMTDPEDDIAMTHDTYLKLWHLNDPVLPYDTILFDEAQDANPVMLDIVQRQQAQQVWVGDPFQELYAWRGALNAMLMIEAPTFHLTQSWRFTHEIADLANDILQMGPLKPDFRIKGVDKPKDIPGIVAIARTNGRLFEEAVSCMERGWRFSVVGGLKDTLKLVRSAHALKYKTGPVIAPEVKRFASWDALKDWAEKYEDRELKLLVRVVSNHGRAIPDICRRLEALETTEDQARLVLSTGHKIKGREFQIAEVLDDFAVPTDDKWDEMYAHEQQAEINVLYVSVTRGAQETRVPEKVLEAILENKAYRNDTAADAEVKREFERHVARDVAEMNRQTGLAAGPGGM